MGCAEARACRVSVTETIHGHPCLCLPISRCHWTPSGSGRCVFTGPRHWTQTQSTREPPVGTVPRPCVCISGDEAHPAHFCGISAHFMFALSTPTHSPLTRGPLCNPHAQPRPLHPTHSSAIFEGRGISLVSILSAQRCPAGCQKKLWEWMADATDRLRTGCLRPMGRKGPGSEQPGRPRAGLPELEFLHRSSQLWLRVGSVSLACFSLVLL